MAKPKRWELEPGFGLIDKAISMRKATDVATAKKVLKQAGLTGESRKGKPAKVVKAADTSKGEARSERPCKGTKERHKGVCKYPEDIKVEKRAARKKAIIRKGKKVLSGLGRKE